MSTGAERRKRADGEVIIAIAWLIVATAVTVYLGPRLGLRGWVWMSVHHVLCIAGSSHGLWRGWKRRQARLAAT
ncbi:MAG: hypothetical protein GY913_05225 [Proteobacteria bacterium]|nr:hypothetical protein [Pseudomonadota bacterium]MCP4916303.1 hypothetical protein [Pseudomonadota bacterium]